MKKYLILKSDKFKDFEVIDPETIKHISYTKNDGDSTLTLSSLQEGMESLEYEDDIADEYAKCVRAFYFEIPRGAALGQTIVQTPEETEIEKFFKVTKSLDDIQLHNRKKGF